MWKKKKRTYNDCKVRNSKEVATYRDREDCRKKWYQEAWLGGRKVGIKISVLDIKHMMPNRHPKVSGV